MFNRKLGLRFLILFFIAFSFAKPVFAMEKTILNEKKTVLPINEKVDNVIVIGHDIDLRGKVDISVIVINGNLKISKTAKINGLVLVLNGNVNQERGSFVKENIVALKFKSEIINHLLIGAALLLSSWFLRFVLSMGLVLLTVLAGFLLKKRGREGITSLKKQTGKLLLIGAITNLTLAGVIFLLIISIIGIPVAIILLIPPFIAYLIGLSILSQYFGEKLIVKFNIPKWVASFVGSFLFISIFNFPLFGWIANLCVFWVSTGMVMLWLRGKLFKKNRQRQK